jgi:hypothetical protein
MLDVNKILGHIYLKTKEGKEVLDISQAIANLAQAKLLGHFKDYRRAIKQSEIDTMLKDLSKVSDRWSVINENKNS